MNDDFPAQLPRSGKWQDGLVKTVELIAIFVGGGWAIWQYSQQIMADRAARSFELMSQVLSTEARESRKRFLEYALVAEGAAAPLRRLSGTQLNRLANAMARTDTALFSAWDASARQLAAVGYCVTYSYCDESLVLALLPDDARVFLIVNDEVIPSVAVSFDPESDPNFIWSKRYNLKFLSYRDGLRESFRIEMEKEGLMDRQELHRRVEEALRRFESRGPAGLLSK